LQGHTDRHPRGGEDPASSAILNEAILASSSSVRDSLPEQHREHFETLRQEIIDFTQAHDIPRESLAKPDALREAAKKLSIPDLQQLALLLERFTYLLKNREPWKNKEALEYAQEHYHLKKQYDSQIKLLEQVGILKEGAITGIDGNTYPIPTLEYIASRLFEQRETLETKRDQGFTKLLLVPFGMSLDALRETLKQFLLKHKKNNPTFDLDIKEPLWTREEYQGADIGDSPKLVYHPKFFDEDNHQGMTKMEILEEQEGNKDSFPGWIVHLLQPSNPKDPHSPGFAPIPSEGQGTPQGDLTPRPPLEAGRSPGKYFSTLQTSKDNEDSPYSHESGMTPEDWIMAFMIHLSETRQPLDNYANSTESASYLTGAFFPSSISVPCTSWNRDCRWAGFGRGDTWHRDKDVGARSSVII